MNILGLIVRMPNVGLFLVLGEIFEKITLNIFDLYIACIERVFNRLIVIYICEKMFSIW